MHAFKQCSLNVQISPTFSSKSAAAAAAARDRYRAIESQRAQAAAGERYRQLQLVRELKISSILIMNAYVYVLRLRDSLFGIAAARFALEASASPLTLWIWISICLLHGAPAGGRLLAPLLRPPLARQLELVEPQVPVPELEPRVRIGV